MFPLFYEGELDNGKYYDLIHEAERNKMVRFECISRECQSQAETIVV